jgi:hypothetical protein
MPKQDAIQLLKDDHKKVQDLFKRFEKSEDTKAKHQIATEAILELEVHAKIEEEIFYPMVREEVGLEEVMDEADEEHHVAKVLMDELMEMVPDDQHFDAKFTVLAENVVHHIKEEETEMLPKAQKIGKERLEEIGERMFERKETLLGEMQKQMSAASSRTPRSRG